MHALIKASSLLAAFSMGVWLVAGEESSQDHDPGWKSVAVKSPHHSRILGIQFSKDSQQFVTTSVGGEVGVWAVAPLQVVRLIEFKGIPIRSASFDPDGKSMALACHDSTVKIVEVGTGKSLRQIPVSDWVSSVEFSGTGDFLAIALTDSRIGNSSWDGSGLLDSYLGIWDLHDRTFRKLDCKDPELSLVRLSEDGHRLIASSPSATHVFDLPGGKLALKIKSNRDSCGFSLSPDQKKLASGFLPDSVPQRVGEVGIWNLESLVRISAFSPERKFNQLCWTVNNSGVLLGHSSSPGYLTEFNLELHRVINLFRGQLDDQGFVWQLSPDGRWCVVGRSTGEVRVFRRTE